MQMHLSFHSCAAHNLLAEQGLLCRCANRASG